MLNLSSLLLFSEQPDVLVTFYSKLFQKEPDWSGGDFKGFQVGNSSVAIGPHDKVHGENTSPERIIFNLETQEFEKEVEHAKAIGATVVQEPYQPAEESGMWIATFADPDGNYFQVTTPFEIEK